MNLSDVQRTLYEYLKQKNIFLILLQFSIVLVLLYPVYILLTRISFLDGIMRIIGYISPILYFSYFLGLILCFAKNEMSYISIAFGVKVLVEIVDMFIFSFNISSIISLVIYSLLTLFAFRYSKNMVR